MAVEKKPKSGPKKTEKKDEPKKIKKESIKLENYKYPISAFIEDNINVRKRVGGGAAFKMWYSFKNKQSLHDKKTMKGWEDLFNKFLNEPIK